MTDIASKIREHLPILGSDNQEIGTVDHLDGENSIKVTRDENGNHHWIPISWVTRVDEHVHLDRTGQHAIDEWADSNPGDL